MGSTLTVVNNTPDTWLCKVGPDEQALSMAAVIIGAISAVSAVLATVGGALPVIASSGGFLVSGVAGSMLINISSILTAAATSATIIGAVSTFGLKVANSINEELKKQNFLEIRNGTSHRFGPMALSLWQQSHCTRTVIVDEKTVRLDTLYMRPIFSGGSPGSNLDHDIQYWLNANGVTSETIKAKEGSV